MNELSLKEKACKSLLANVLDMDDDLRSNNLIYNLIVKIKLLLLINQYIQYIWKVEKVFKTRQANMAKKFNVCNMDKYVKEGLIFVNVRRQ